MHTLTIHKKLVQQCKSCGSLLRPPASNQQFVRVIDKEQLSNLSKWLVEQHFNLVALIGTDEREMLDGCFKLIYLFSHIAHDVFLFVEHPLGPVREGIPEAHQHLPEEQYSSLSDEFLAVESFENELIDMLGIWPIHLASPTLPVTSGYMLHEEVYPPALYPLRRDRHTGQIRKQIEAFQENRKQLYANKPVTPQSMLKPERGQWILPVGPIHAGVIGPGCFTFRLDGEVIEELHIRLGYNHRGIEKLFQSSRTLENGWQLAEHLAGDSPFAHSLAYCRAAEALAGKEKDIPRTIELRRGLFLELERMANHIANCSALAADIAFEVPAMKLAELRERILRLNATLAGHRLLRGVNRPGGINRPYSVNVETTWNEVSEVAREFKTVTDYLSQHHTFRVRFQWTGTLTYTQAKKLGTTGLVARASGILRDFRLEHPTGIYTDRKVQEKVEEGVLGLLLFREDELKDHKELLQRTRNQSDHLPQYLCECFSDIPQDGPKSKVIETLNHLLKEPDLQQQLEGIALPEKVRRLNGAEITGEKLHPEQLMRFNRWLLEAAFRDLFIAREERDIEDREVTAGDVLARFLIRKREVETSSEIIKYILKQQELQDKAPAIQLDFRQVVNWAFAIGYVEGWRGDSVCFLMKDKFEQIFRCKLRDPSVLNWVALKAAIEPHELGEDPFYLVHYNPPTGCVETLLGDFPIVNKSFNLSYGGASL